MPLIEIYTDGSCYPKENTGAWAALIFTGNDKTVLTGEEINTTHNKMELMAVIKAIDYIISKQLLFSSIVIFSDSQYVVNIPLRKVKLKASQFITKKGNQIQNYDLIQTLIYQIETYNLKFIKVKAHQKQGDLINYNREVDKLVRHTLRRGKN